MLEKEDWEERACLVCDATGEEKRPSVPVGRIVEKLDEHLASGDEEGAERHLLYWKSEALAIGDKRGLLAIENEFMGLYRRTGDAEKALQAADSALALLGDPDIAGVSATEGTTYVNAATCKKAFGDPAGAIELFEKARAAYENLPEGDFRTGGLLNNMALALVDLGRYDEAEQNYKKAIETMEKGGFPGEAAISELNLATMYETMGGEGADDKIDGCLERAKKLLDGVSKRDRSYVFTLEKCAPAFENFGMIAYAKELKKRINEGA